MRFSQLLLILRARMWLVLLVFLVTIGTTLTISLLLPKQYTAQADVVINTAASDPLGGSQLPSMMMSSYLGTQVDIIGSRHVALKVVDALGLRSNEVARQQFIDETGGEGDIGNWLAESLLDRLDAKPGRDTNVISISYQAADPRFAAAVANLFAEAYIQANLDLTVQPAQQSATWFDEQLKTLRDRLEEAQTNLSSYQREYGITSTDDRLDVEIVRLAELSSRLVATQADTYESESRLDQSGNQGEINENMPEVLSSPLVQQLKVRVAQEEGKLLELSTNLGRNHPQFQRAEQELMDLKMRLDEEISSVVEGIKTNAAAARQREAATRKAVEEQRLKILEMRKQRDHVAVLKREVENAQGAYEFAMERATQTTLQSQVGHTNVALLNPAIVPTTASSPIILLNMLLSVFLGGVLSVGIALFAEFMNRKVRSSEDISEDLDMPVIGVLERSVIKKRWWQIGKSRDAETTLLLAEGS